MTKVKLYLIALIVLPSNLVSQTSAKSCLEFKNLIRLIGDSAYSAPEQSLRFSEEAYPLLNQCNNDTLTARYYGNSAQIYSIVGNIKKAIPYYLEAANYYGRINKPHKVSQFLYNIAYDYYIIGSYPESIKYLEKALEIDRELNNKSTLIYRYSLLSLIYSKMEHYEKAQLYIRKLISDAIILKDTLFIVHGYERHATNFGRMNEIDSAFYYYEKSELLCRKNNLTHELEKTLCNYGSLLIDHKKYKLAKEKVEEAIKLDLIHSDTTNYVLNSINLAALYNDQNNYQESLKTLKGIQTLLTDTKTTAGITNLKFYYENLSIAHKGLKMYESALNNYEKYNIFYSKEQKNKFDEEMASLSTKLNISELEDENSNLKEKSTLEQLAIKKQKQTITIISASGLLITLISIVLTFFYLKNKRLNKELRASNDSNKMLMKEIHHRVKNNLQMVSSLLELQSHETTNNEALKALNEGRSRVNSIALLHNKLYQNEDVSKVNFSEYVKMLCDQISDSFSATQQSVLFEIDIPPTIILDIDKAIPLSLILNELITNSYKHAFKIDTENKVQIALKRKSEENLDLHYKDTGPGYDFEKASSKGTLGLSLIKILSRQLGADFHLKLG